MKENVISNLSIIINSIIFFMMGIILIVVPTGSLAIFHFTVSTSIILLGFISCFFNIIRKRNIQNTLVSLLLILIGTFFYNNTNSFLAIFPLAFSIYILISGVIKLVTFFIYKIRKFKGFIRLLINSILDFVFSLIIIFNPLKSLKALTCILGIYFIMIAFNYLLDFLEEYNFKTKKRRFRITIPNFLSLMIPYAFYVKINKFLNREVTNVKIDKNTSGKVDLEIFISVKDSVIGSFGHTDLYFDGKIYSYGHYDDESKWLFDSIGDGVLYIVKNKKKYLRFCTEHSQKTIFIFGLTLSERQKEKVRKELAKIESYTYRWKCLQEQNKDEEYSDYTSCLYRATKAKFFKFKESNYKLYFAFWTNCVKLVDNVLGTTGSDILRLNGFITPGTYYYYLNNEFKKKKSNVIKKEIITNKNIYQKEKKD